MKYASNVVACERPSSNAGVEPSSATVTASAYTQDIKDVANLLADDLLIAYGLLSHNSNTLLIIP